MSSIKASSQTNLGAFLRSQCGSVKEAFNLFEKTASGQLRKVQFAAGLKKLGYPGVLTGVFEEMDTRGSGTIGLREFMVYFTTSRIESGHTPEAKSGSCSAGLQDDTGSCAIMQKVARADVQPTMQDDTGSTGVRECSVDVQGLKQDIEAMAKALKQELDMMQSQHQSQHMFLMQAMQARPVTADVEKLVRSEVERSAAMIGKKDVEGDLVGAMGLRTEPSSVDVRATLNALKLNFDERLAASETKALDNIRCVVWPEIVVKIEAEAKLCAASARSNASEKAMEELSHLIYNTMVTEAEKRLMIEITRLDNRLLEAESTMMELADDETLQKRCLPFHHTSEAPIVAHEALSLATEAQEGFTASQALIEKLRGDILLIDQKHAAFAERVMEGLQGVTSPTETNPKKQRPSPPVATTVIAKSQSCSTVHEHTVPNTGDISSSVHSLKSLCTTATASPASVCRVTAVDAWQKSVSCTTPSAVHIAVQALREDLLGGRLGVQNNSVQSPPASPHKENTRRNEGESPMFPNRAMQKSLSMSVLSGSMRSAQQWPCVQAQPQQLSYVDCPVRTASPAPSPSRMSRGASPPANTTISRMRGQPTSSPQASPTAVTRSMTPHDTQGPKRQVTPAVTTVIQSGGSSKVPVDGSASLPAYMRGITPVRSQHGAFP